MGPAEQAGHQKQASCKGKFVTAESSVPVVARAEPRWPACVVGISWFNQRRGLFCLARGDAVAKDEPVPAAKFGPRYG